MKNFGYKVLTLDFKAPLKSSHYNFLQPVIDAVLKNDIPLAENKAADIVESLVGEAKGEKIWNDGEKSTIKAGIMAVVVQNAKENPEYCNLYNVYMFLSEMCKEQADKTMLMDTFLEDLPKSHPANAAFAPASIAPSKTRASFFTSALNTLNLFTDSYIATMIKDSEITAEEICDQKTALFMILPDEKVTFYGLCSLFVNQIYQQFVTIADNNGGILKRRVNFILDEFGNFSAIPNFGGFLTVGGGRGIRFNMFLQSFSQLNEKYGDNTAQNILDNCYVWNYLKTSNEATAEKISKKIGTYTTSTFSESSSINNGGASGSSSSSMNLSQRALLTPDEVLRINRPWLLVMCSGKNPAITKAPDLSKWNFNKMLGLGDMEHNAKLRKVLQEARMVQEVEVPPVWNIAEITMQKKKEKAEELQRSRMQERERSFRNFNFNN